MSTPRHTARVNNTRVHWTCQHHGTLHMSTTPGYTGRVNTTAHCTRQQHPGTLHVSTTPGTLHMSTLAGQMNITTLSTLHMSTLDGQMNIATRTGHTAHVNTRCTNEYDNNNWVHCTCKHHGTLHVSTTPGHIAHVNNIRAHCTCQ